MSEDLSLSTAYANLLDGIRCICRLEQPGRLYDRPHAKPSGRPDLARALNPTSIGSCSDQAIVVASFIMVHMLWRESKAGICRPVPTHQQGQVRNLGCLRRRLTTTALPLRDMLPATGLLSGPTHLRVHPPQLCPARCACRHLCPVLCCLRNAGKLIMLSGSP